MEDSFSGIATATILAKRSSEKRKAKTVVLGNIETIVVHLVILVILANLVHRVTTITIVDPTGETIAAEGVVEGVEMMGIGKYRIDVDEIVETIDRAPGALRRIGMNQLRWNTGVRDTKPKKT